LLTKFQTWRLMGIRTVVVEKILGLCCHPITFSLSVSSCVSLSLALSRSLALSLSLSLSLSLMHAQQEKKVTLPNCLLDNLQEEYEHSHPRTSPCRLNKGTERSGCVNQTCFLHEVVWECRFLDDMLLSFECVASTS